MYPDSRRLKDTTPQNRSEVPARIQPTRGIPSNWVVDHTNFTLALRRMNRQKARTSMQSHCRSQRQELRGNSGERFWRSRKDATNNRGGKSSTSSCISFSRTHQMKLFCFPNSQGRDLPAHLPWAMEEASQINDGKPVATIIISRG